MIAPVLVIVFLFPEAKMPLELLPCVLIAPLFMIVLDPSRAAIASDPVLPSVLIVPELLIVFAPPVADTPFVSPVTLMLPESVMVKLSPALRL